MLESDEVVSSLAQMLVKLAAQIASGLDDEKPVICLTCHAEEMI